MARDMTEAERRAFLSEGTRTAKLAVVRADGRPLVTPVWFMLEEDDVVFTTHATSGKGKALQREPRVCLVVDDETAPYAFVMIEAKAELSEDPDALRQWATRIGGRYMGADRAEEYGARNGVPGEFVVRLHPTRIVAKSGIAD